MFSTVSIMSALLVSWGCDSVKAQRAPDATAPKEAMRSEDLTAAPPPDMASVMRSKVAWSSSLLEAVAMRNYDLVASNADALKRISEQSGFLAQDTVAYRTLAQQFRTAVTQLAADARDGNQAAVEASYVRVTESCFHCHTHMRAERFGAEMPGRTGM